METPERVSLNGNLSENSGSHVVVNDSKDESGEVAAPPAPDEHEYVHVSSSNGVVQDNVDPDSIPSMSEFMPEGGDSRITDSSPDSFLAASLGGLHPDYQFPPTAPTPSQDFNSGSGLNADFSELIKDSKGDTGMRSRSPNTPTKGKGAQNESKEQGFRAPSEAQGAGPSPGVWSRCWMAMFGCCRKKRAHNGLQDRLLSGSDSGQDNRPTSNQLKA